MTLKFYNSVEKGLKLKVRKLQAIIPTFVEVTWEKLVGGPFHPPPILNRVNTRSINRHLIDLAYDKRLRKSYLICLTGAQMMQGSQTEINSELQEFEIIHNTKVDRFQSFAFCLKDHIWPSYQTVTALEETCIKWDAILLNWICQRP